MTGRLGLGILALMGSVILVPAVGALQTLCVPSIEPTCRVEKQAYQAVVFGCDSANDPPKANDELQQPCEGFRDDVEEAASDQAVALVDPLLSPSAEPDREPETGSSPEPDAADFAFMPVEGASVPGAPEPLREDASDPPILVPSPQDPPEPDSPAVAALGSVAPRSGGPSPEALVGAGAAVVTVAGFLYGAGAFYNRLNRQRVEANPVRSRVFEHVRRRPGSTPADVARALDIHPTTVVHHLRILARFEQVVIHDGAGRPSYFENHGRVPVADRRAWLLLRRPGNAALVQAVRSRKALRLRDLAPALGVSVSTAGYRAAQLAAAGLLERQKEGWRLSEMARRLLDHDPAPASTAVASEVQGPGSGLPSPPKVPGPVLANQDADAAFVASGRAG